jgi:hypothetical protein
MCYNIRRWYEPASGRYISSDPAKMAWAISPTPFLYAGATPLMTKDPSGLFQIQGSCNQVPWAGLVQSGVDDACKRAATPGTGCYEALLNVGSSLGKDIIGCIKSNCDGQTQIGCDACNPYCAQTNAAPFSPGGGVITIGRGNGGCPVQRGLGLGETIFHETLHICAFGGTEPSGTGPQAAWFRYLESACYKWRDVGAPPPTYSPR